MTSRMTEPLHPKPHQRSPIGRDGLDGLDHNLGVVSEVDRCVGSPPVSRHLYRVYPLTTLDHANRLVDLLTFAIHRSVRAWERECSLRDNGVSTDLFVSLER